MVEDKKKEKKLLLDHEYDGIRELDNDLPPWWINLFYITIVFGVIYLLGYQVFNWFDNQNTEYQKEVIAHEELLYKNEHDQKGAVGGGVVDKKQDIAAGKEIFQTNCVACHKSKGEGSVGPNLTDKFWIHGGDFESVQRIISEGVPAKGMLAWKQTISAKSIREVAHFVLSLQGTNPPDAKAPEGILYDPIDLSKPMALLSDKESLDKGIALYQQYCSACHGENKKGGFASNLADKIWTQGNGSLVDIMKITSEGNIPLKMPGWKNILTEKQIQEVSSYILTNDIGK